MERTRRLFPFAFGILIIVLLFSVWIAPRASRAAAETSPKTAVMQAWEQARAAGRYHFSTRLVQTTHPAPALANVGSSPRVETVYLEGQTNLKADILRLRVWQDGGRLSDPAQAAEIRETAPGRKLMISPPELRRAMTPRRFWLLPATSRG